MAIFCSYVKLPEGNLITLRWKWCFTYKLKQSQSVYLCMACVELAWYVLVRNLMKLEAHSYGNHAHLGDTSNCSSFFGMMSSYHPLKNHYLMVLLQGFHCIRCGTRAFSWFNSNCHSLPTSTVSWNDAKKQKTPSIQHHSTILSRCFPHQWHESYPFFMDVVSCLFPHINRMCRHIGQTSIGPWVSRVILRPRSRISVFSKGCLGDVELLRCDVNVDAGRGRLLWFSRA